MLISLAELLIIENIYLLVSYRTFKLSHFKEPSLIFGDAIPFEKCIEHNGLARSAE